MKCNMDCLNCSFNDCVNDSDLISMQERELSASLDKDILNSRVPTYIPTNGTRPYDILPFNFKKSQQRYHHKKQYYKDVDKSREQGRQSYYRNRDRRLAHNKEYYSKNREEILSQKKSYYEEHREEILKSRKSKYVPHPKQVIDTPEAQRKRELERARYQAKKEEINRRRKERRRLLNEDNKVQQTSGN